MLTFYACSHFNVGDGYVSKVSFLFCSVCFLHQNNFQQFAEFIVVVSKSVTMSRFFISNQEERTFYDDLLLV